MHLRIRFLLSDKDKTVTYVTTEKQYHVALYARLSVEKGWQEK